MKKDPADPPDPTLTGTGSPAGEPTAQASNTPLDIGAIAGARFRISAMIGHGAMGSVYLARDTISGERVAIKVLRGAGNASTRLARLRRELRAARLITHPGVVRLNDLFILGDRLALSMEYVEGETLAKRLSTRLRLGAEELLSLATQLAGALAAAHAAGVVHRDLKPANILLRAGSDQLVIADFGISRIDREIDGDLAASAEIANVNVNDLTQTRDILGTPSYMAPEQLVPGQDVGPAADIYAVGLILYEAAAGTRPHPVSTLEELQEARQRAEIPSLGGIRPDLPADFVAIVERCLRSDPRARFESGRALDMALGRAPSGAQPATSLSSPPPRVSGPPAVRAPDPKRSRPALRSLTLGLSFGTLVLAGAFGLWWHRGGLPSADRRVRLKITAAPGAPLQEAASRLGEQLLHERAERFAVARPPAEANVVLEVRYRLEGHVVHVDGTLGRIGGRSRPLGTVVGEAIGPALATLLDEARSSLDAGQSPRPPDAEERRAMEAVDARTLGAFRAYEEILTKVFARLPEVDVPRFRAAHRRLLDLDPGWPHALALGYSSGAKRAESIERADPTRDPAGRELLASMDAFYAGRIDEAITRQTRLFHERPTALTGWILASSLGAGQRSDERVAVLQRLMELRPDLQFGADLVRLLEKMERGQDIPSILARWLARAPESEAALAANAYWSLRHGDSSSAARYHAELRLLYGDVPKSLRLWCDLRMNEGRLDEARAIALKLAALDSAQERGRGQHRLATLAVLEGRFERALELVSAARSVIPRDNGEQLPLLQLGWSIHSVTGNATGARELAKTLAQELASSGRPEASIIRMEAEAAPGRGRPCATARLAPEAPGLPDAPSMRAHHLRALAAHDCGDCEAVVRAGLLSREELPWSLFSFGACAERTRSLELARRAFELLEPLGAPDDADALTNSPVHSILARYELGKVLERLGRNAEARAKYESFLAAWGHADRPLAQVDDARKRLARLPH